MRILHLSASDNLGGAARSAYRVHTGLRRLGVESRMLVGWKTLDDADVAPVAPGGWYPLDRASHRLTDWLSQQYLFVPSSLVLPRRRWVREADLIQLYNTHGGYFSHTVLPALGAGRPLVWRFSDMWPITGHCSYAFDCTRWRTGCGACPQLDSYPRLRRDRTASLWERKRRLYKRSPLTVVTPSKWLAGFARESPLLEDVPVHVIPNGLDTEVFRPIDKAQARRQLGVSANARVLLFGAQFTAEARKGGAVLREALGTVAAASAGAPVELIVLGHDTLEWPEEWAPRLHRLGAVHDDAALAAAYSAADVCVSPTLAENLPNTVLESMACGTPVVACKVGGMPEVVRHLENGYLVEPNDPDALAMGLVRLLADEPLRARLGQAARARIEQEHTLAVQAERFAALYTEVIDAWRAAA